MTLGTANQVWGIDVI